MNYEIYDLKILLCKDKIKIYLMSRVEKSRAMSQISEDKKKNIEKVLIHLNKRQIF